MITEKGIVKTVAIFSDDHNHRYLLAKQWAKDKPTVCIIMLYPGLADDVQTDLTTTLVVNNAVSLGFGEIQIVNLYSLIGENGFNEQTDAQIIKSCKCCDKIIVAWGSIGSVNKTIARRQKKILSLIGDNDKSKFLQIGEGLHPLAPKARKGWELTAFQFPTPDS